MDGIWKFAAGASVIGLLAGMWDKIKAFGWRALNLLVQRIEVPTQAGHEAVTAYLIANFQRSRNYDRMYGASWEYQRDGRYGLIPDEQFGNRTLILWNGWFAFLFANQQEQKSGGKTGEQSHYSTATKVYSTLTFVRGTLDVETILREACDVRNRISWAAEDAEQEAKTRFVIHHENAPGTHTALAARFSRTIGNSTFILVPAPGSLVISIRPRAFQMIERQIDNPKPLPFFFVVKNGS